MKYLRLFLSSLFLSTVFYHSALFAAAYQLYELGTPVIGSAAVGQAIVEDASAAYFNPAMMGLSPNSQFMLGSQMLVTYTNFDKNIKATTIRGDNGGNAGALSPGMDLFYDYNYSPALKFGVSVTTPYAGSLDYTDGWVGRYVVQNVLFYTINLNPSLAYRVNPWLSLGIGASLEYMNLQENIALPLRIVPFIGPFIDGQAKVSVASFDPGFNLGATLVPFKTTKIGIAFRSQIVHHLHGNTTFLRINDTPDTSTKMIMPANLMVSLAEKISQQFILMGEAGWAHWSSMRNTIVRIANYSSVTTLNWRDTYRVGLGGQFAFNPCLSLQLGASYDSSPTSSSHRLPDLPMDRQIRIGAGLLYRIQPKVALGTSYEYLNFGHANINNISPDGSLVGSYSRNYGSTVQVSLNVDI